MAERKFDYNNVKTVYSGMTSITERIKTLLTESNEAVSNRVSVVDEALHGDLGKQMLLNWENISSNFPNFVDNFDNWAALVSKASGDYHDFETDVARFKEANSYGATSGGIKASFVSTSDYNNTLTADQIKALDVQLRLYNETAATYIDTGMVEYAKKHKRHKAVSIGFDLLAGITAVAGGVKIAKSAISFLKGPIGAGKLSVHQTLKGIAFNSARGLKGLKHTTKFAGTYAKLLLKGGKTSNKISTAFWSSIKTAAEGATKLSVASAGNVILSEIAYHTGSEYDPNKYMTGADAYLSAGQGVTIENQDYCFIGATPGGQKLLTDLDGKIYYIDSKQNVVPVSVTDGSGQEIDATLETMEENFTMGVGEEIITQDTTLRSYVKEEYEDVVNTENLMDSVYSGDYSVVE